MFIRAIIKVIDVIFNLNIHVFIMALLTTSYFSFKVVGLMLEEEPETITLVY